MLKRIRHVWAIIVAAWVLVVVPLPIADGTMQASAVTTVQVQHVVKTTPEYDWPTIAVDAAEIAVGVGALIGLPAIAYQVREARRNAISERTARLQEQWGSREFMGELSPVNAYLATSSSDDCIEKIRAWLGATHGGLECLPRTPRDPGAPSASQLDVLHVLVFFEDLCQRYNNRELNRLLVASSIGPELLVRFTEASWYIHWQRAVIKDDFLYGEWQKALLDLRRPRPRWRDWRHWRRGVHPVYAYLRETKAEFKIRAVCVPPDPRTASSDEWVQAARLAKALARNTALSVEQLPKHRSPVIGSSKEERGWTVVLVPPSLDQPPDQHEWNRAVAVAIEARLDDMGDAEIEKAIDAIEAGGRATTSFDIALCRLTH